MQQQRYQQPSKEEVRMWMREVIESRRPPPAPEIIRNQLWTLEERERQASLS